MAMAIGSGFQSWAPLLGLRRVILGDIIVSLSSGTLESISWINCIERKKVHLHCRTWTISWEASLQVTFAWDFSKKFHLDPNTPGSWITVGICVPNNSSKLSELVKYASPHLGHFRFSTSTERILL